MRTLGLLLQVVGSSIGGVTLFALGAGSLQKIVTATGLTNEFLFALGVLSIASGVIWKVGNKLYERENVQARTATAG